jgi:hypothetical protein
MCEDLCVGWSVCAKCGGRKSGGQTLDKVVGFDRMCSEFDGMTREASCEGKVQSRADTYIYDNRYGRGPGWTASDTEVDLLGGKATVSSCPYKAARERCQIMFEFGVCKRVNPQPLESVGLGRRMDHHRKKERDELRSERRTWYNRLVTVDVGKVTEAWQDIEGRD